MRLTNRTKKRLAVLLAFVMVASMAVIGGQVLRSARHERALETAIREGTAAYEAGDYPTAMRHLRFYVTRRREHDAALMLADAQRRVPQENRRHIPAAIHVARIAADLDPESIAARELLVELFHEAGFATEAVATAEALLELDPAHKRAREIRMVARARLGNFEDALKDARTLAEAHPDEIEAYRQVAQFMQLTDHSLGEIREYLEQVADRAEHDFRFALMYAESALLTGDVEEGLARARQAATLPIKTGDQLAQFLRLLDTLAATQPEARDIAEMLMDGNPDRFPQELQREVAVVAAERAWRSGRNDLAWQYLQTAVEAESLSDVPASALGWWILMQEGTRDTTGEVDLAAALDRKLDHLRTRETDEARAWLAIIDGNQAMAEGNLRESVERLEHAHTFNQRSTSALAEFLLGQLDRRSGEWRRASLRWEALLREYPNWRTLRTAHVSLLIDNAQYDDAIERAEAALGWSRGRSEALLLCRAIMALLESRQADAVRTTQVLSLLESIVQQATSDGAIQATAARAYLAANRPDRAGRAIERILDPEAVPPPADLVMPLSIAYRTHDAEVAGRLLELAQATTGSPDALYARAVALADEGSPEEARQLIEQAIEAAPQRERLTYQFRLVRLLTYLGDDEAVSLLASLAVEHNHNPEMQRALLENDAAWYDEALITAAVQRLREAAGEDSNSWRLHDARRLLTFNPSSARASQAVQVLSPFLRQHGDESVGRDPMAFALAGEAYLLLDGRERAIDFFARAVDLQPTRPNFYPRLIEVLSAAGRTDEASRRLTAFARIESLPIEHQRMRAQLALAQGAWDLAYSDFSALASAPTASLEDRFGLATVHLRRGQPQPAAAILERIAQSPQATPAMLVAAADLRAGGATQGAEREAAIEAGRQILENAPADLPPQLRQALIAAYLQRHGQAEGAEELLIAAAQQPGEAQGDAIAELARFYLDTGRLDEAEEVLRGAGSQHADHSAIARVRALLRIQRGDEDPEAWAELSEVLSAWPDAPPALRLLTDAMHRRAANPEDTAGHITRVQAITRDHPTFYTGWQILVQMLVEVGDLGRASQAAQSAARAMPADPRPAQLAASTLIQEQRYEDALAAATQWRSRSAPDTFNADVLAAWLNQQLARPQDGLRLLEPWRQRLIDNPDHERLGLLAGLLIDAGRTPEASRLLWPHIEGSEGPSTPRVESLENPWTLQYLALTPRIQDHSAARDWLSRIQPLLATDSQGRLAMGEAWFGLLQRTRTPREAEQVRSLLTDLTTDPDVGFTAHMLLAGAHEAIDDQAEAERHYRAALALNPDDIIALNNFAYMLAHQGSSQGGSPLRGEEGTSTLRVESANEAVTLATRAATLAREQGFPDPVLRAIIDTQGVALLAAQRWPEAEAAFREALAIEPNAPDLLIGLAEARFHQGEREDATALIEQARARSTQDLPATRAARLSALEAELGR